MVDGMKKISLLILLCTLVPLATAEASEATIIAENVFQHILAPGPLHPSHSPLQGIDNCGACHSMTSGVSQKKCLACHKKIGQRLALKQGNHGRFDTACLRCHTGHKESITTFDRQGFNHGLSQFPLSGKHTRLACEKCHQSTTKSATAPRFRFLGLPMECGGCHQNIHATEKMKKCASCHQTTGWTVKGFAHSEKTAFPLRGLHKITPCQKCHPGMDQKDKTKLQFKITNHSSCLSCHKDTHRGKLTTQCLDCHTMNGWRGENRFEHDKARFKLVGKHQGVICLGCHKDSQFKGLAFDDCGRCHQQKTVHKTRIKKCGACHNPTGWLNLNPRWQENRTFHQELRYPLQGAHLKVACEKCHGKEATKNYWGVPSSDCKTCHTDPHKGELQAACHTCHLETDFKDHTLFDHGQATFKLDSRHQKIKCRTCHPQKSFKQAQAACADCHLEVTRFSRGLWGDQWRTKRIISPKARLVACTDCHAPSSSTKVTGEQCLDCHGATYKEFFLVRAQLATTAIATLRGTYADAVACLGHETKELQQVKQQLDMLEKNYVHNYRLADQSFKILDQKLSEVLHENCPQ